MGIYSQVWIIIKADHCMDVKCQFPVSRLITDISNSNDNHYQHVCKLGLWQQLVA